MSDPTTAIERGVLRFRQGDLAGALEDFDRAVRSGPDDPTAYNNRGLARRGPATCPGRWPTSTTPSGCAPGTPTPWATADWRTGPAAGPAMP
jgi:hypothetical protein